MSPAAEPVRLLIVWHSRTGAAQAMAQSCATGAAQAAGALEQAEALEITRLRACDCTGEHLLGHQGYIFCAPENLAGLAGEMKEFFDRCYYEALDRIGGRPYAAAISAGTDGAGAARQLERICTGWRLRQAAPTLIARNGAQTAAQILAPKTVEATVLQQCNELGGLLAATLLMGR